MAWRKIGAALAIASVVGILLTHLEFPWYISVLAGTIAYCCVRWLMTWVHRIKFWYNRGTQDIYSRSCPECGQYIYRLGGDWILQCKRCGWTAGWPGIRWFTQSVPSRQLRRTVLGPRLVIVVLAIGLISMSYLAFPTYDIGENGSDGPSFQVNPPNISLPDFSSNSTATGTVSDADTDGDGPIDIEVPTINLSSGGGNDRENSDTSDTSINESETERLFIELLNEERQSRDLQTVEPRDVLTEMGNAHADNMAEHDYLGHTWPDGTTIRDRYRERGLLPECRLPKADSNRFYPGAENAAQTWVGRNLLGEAGPSYIDSESDLSRQLFSMWMQSPPHREAMLVYSADEAGLGINITEDGKVFASLELC